MATRILFSLITIIVSANLWAVRSVQFDVGDESYHLGFFGTYFQGEYGALALSPDIIFKPDDETIFAPAAYWYLQPENAFFQELSFGVRGYFAEYTNDGEKEDVGAAALALLARSQVLSLNWPFYLMFGITYAPNELTFGDAENLFSWNALLEYELVQQFFVYGGYRYIVVEATSGDEVHLQDTPYLGIRLQF